MKIAPVALQDIARKVCGEFPAGNPPQKFIDNILIDSRSAVPQPDTSLFTALKTRSNDGHKYIGELYAKGVRNFLVSRLPEEDFPQAVFLKVPDTLQALQTWAAAHRQSFRIPVVGITGSNGKTWVKEWLHTLLAVDGKVVSNPKSYNSQIGVPLSLLQIEAGHTVGIFEAGISLPGEMEVLNRMISPTAGIFTNIGTAHDANFENREQKIREKLKLFEGVRTLVYCADFKEVDEAVKSDPALQGVHLLSWSAEPSVGNHADLVVNARTVVEGGSEIEAVYQGENLKLFIPFLDRISFENAMHCWLFMLGEGYAQEEIASRFMRLQAVEMRMEMQQGALNSLLISDVYNSDFNSFSMALDFLCSHGHSRKKCVILSDILQSALNEEQLYGDVAQALQSRGIDDFVGIGEALCRNRSLFACGRFYASTSEFISCLNPVDYAGKAVLLKGARVFAFERISRLMQMRVHETVMEVNVTALVHNLKYFRSLIKPETKLMVMGKAFSYGSGSHEIADILEFNHVDYLTVAYPDEAVTLRHQGIRLPIMCINAESEGMETLLKYNVEPVIYNFRILDTLQAYLNHIGESGTDSVKVHIKLDTGMHRMGFEEPDLERLSARLQADPRLHVQSVFTHLATADMPEMEKYTLGQLENFERMSSRLIAAFPYKVMRHCLNTAGIFHYPQFQYDMVRLGIGLYGVGTDSAMQSHLETVSTLKTSISSIRHIAAGEAVSYGRRFVAERDTTVGVIGIGYADGLNRHLGGGRGRVYVNGAFAPIIGSICMDMCMIDLTGIEAREHDEVIVFGRELPVNEVADILDTIPYEVLTSISPRIPRVYYQE